MQRLSALTTVLLMTAAVCACQAAGGGLWQDEMPRLKSTERLQELRRESIAVKRELKQFEQEHGADSPKLIPLLHHLGDLYRDQNLVAEALRYYMRAWRICKSDPETLNRQLAENLSRTARVYMLQFQHARAVPLLRKAVSMLKAQLGGEHPALLEHLTLLARLYVYLERYEEAARCYGPVPEITRKLRGENHLETAQSLYNLARLYIARCEYARAMPLLQQAAGIQAAMPGENDADLANTLSELALLHELDGHYAEAGPLYQRILEIRERALEGDSPALVETMMSLGLAYQKQGEYLQSAAMYEGGLALQRKHLGPDHPDLEAGISNLAALDLLFTEKTDGPALHRQIMDARSRKLANDPAMAAAGLNIWGRVCLKNKAYDDAEKYLARALEIYREAKLLETLEGADILLNLGYLHTELDQVEKAENRFREALLICENTLAPVHSFTATVMEALAGLLDVTERGREADTLQDRAAAIRQALRERGRSR